MKKLAVAGIVAAAIYTAIMFLTSAGAQPGDIALQPGNQFAACPEGHRVRGQYDFLDQARIRLLCLTPSGVVTAIPSPSPTPTQPPAPPTIPPATATPTPSPIVSSHPNCQNRPPLGGVGLQRPIWCALPLGPEVITHVNGPNSWEDNWQHFQNNARLDGNGYVVGHVGDNCDALHFRSNSVNAHWMADVASHGNGALCASWLRPDRTFTAPNKLIVEMEVAVPIAGTRSNDQISDSWPEFVISTAGRPANTNENSWGSPIRKNGTYFYEAFPRSWTFGCRMQQSRHPICALYNDGQSFAGSSDRIWEINQNGGDVTDEFGGGPPAPGSARDIAWKQCTNVDDPDTVCRNIFRFEITDTRIKISVNGVRYYEAGLIDSQLSRILDGPFYVYNAEFWYRLADGAIGRSHWDRLFVSGE